MPKIVTTEQMRAIETAADAGGHPYAAMMDLAGQAIAERVMLRLATDFNTKTEARVLLLVGPGNNGGDGLVAARYLKENYPAAHVSCYLLKPRQDAVLADVREAGVFIADAENDVSDRRVLRNLVLDADILVDALLGIGTRLPLEGEAAAYLKTVRTALENRRANSPRKRNLTPTEPLEELIADPTVEAFQEEVPVPPPPAPLHDCGGLPQRPGL
ncbi:MAG: hypothetical protein HC915_02745 [Anaerolineae bacterium]|nr:hypothetical protein [Anaerolineae bacterium]